LVIPHYLLRQENRLSTSGSNQRSLIAIFTVSVLILFLEMALIRWLGAEIRILAYLQNIVLITCFMGIGLGCQRAEKPLRWIECITPLLLLLALVQLPVSGERLQGISEQLSVFSDFVIWGQVQADSLYTAILWALTGLILLSVLLFLVASSFIPLGQLLGKLLDDYPDKIPAYSANVFGSLVGIWLFAALCHYWAGPPIWFAVVVLLSFLVSRQTAIRLGVLNTALLLTLPCIAALRPYVFSEPGHFLTLWTPYQKISVAPGSLPESFELGVNSVGYQYLLNGNKEYIERNRRFFPPRFEGYGPYDIPFRFGVAPKKVLIVGGGGGNDAAGALRAGAEEVTIVEIDPGISDIGRKYHPESPLASPKVRLILDDARAFFSSSNEKFDIIIFGLLDAHTSANQGTVRLDHFVYTRESFTHARRLLKDDGVLVVKFFVLHSYIADRLQALAQEVFSPKTLRFTIPLSAYGPQSTTIVASPGRDLTIQPSADSALDSLIREWSAEERVDTANSIPTDDWPYIYLQAPSIPTLFFIIAAVILVMCYTLTKILFPENRSALLCTGRNSAASAFRVSWCSVYAAGSCQCQQSCRPTWQHLASKCCLYFGNSHNDPFGKRCCGSFAAFSLHLDLRWSAWQLRRVVFL
jgi:SAM-dependent methyltransferase